MEKQSNFIVTDTEEDARTLMALGFQVVQASGGYWLFLNDKKKAKFAEGQDKDLKFAYTNKMLF